jgi:ubiquinone biosynthesis protein UbiJ
VDTFAAELELYGLPPEDFIAARNDLAKAAMAAGDVAASAQVKALRKPTLAAWSANQLVRAAPERIDELTELGAELRDAHLSRDGARLRILTPRRHALVTELVRTARSFARDRGRKLTDAVAERLTETLDAALVDPGAAQMLRSGRLTSALRHVGFGVVDEAGVPAQLASTAPQRPARTPAAAERAKPKAPSRADDKALQLRRQQLHDQVAEAVAEYDEAEAERAKVELVLDANEHHIADMRTAIERLNDELERVRRELKDAQAQTGRLERAVAQANRAAAVAARRRDASQQRLADLDG